MIRNKFKDKFDLKDAIILIGAGLLFYGVWMIYPPAAFIVIALILIVAGLR